jgi:hypothetical protein
VAVRADGKSEIERTTLTGTVRPLAEVVEKFGVKLDADVRATEYALVTEDAKIYPLLKDEGSRLFFRDARLLRRPMQLTGRVLPHSQLLQVLEVRSMIQGKPHEVYYWCDVCSIKTYELKICECCGGPVELRERPVPK